MKTEFSIWPQFSNCLRTRTWKKVGSFNGSESLEERERSQCMKSRRKTSLPQFKKKGFFSALEQNCWQFWHFKIHIQLEPCKVLIFLLLSPIFLILFSRCSLDILIQSLHTSFGAWVVKPICLNGGIKFFELGFSCTEAEVEAKLPNKIFT